MKILHLKVETSERIDKYIAQHSDLSRVDIQKLIENQAVWVDDILVRKASFVLKVGMEIKVHQIKPPKSNLKAESISLDIIYEDQDIIVINKPSGMVVHPAPGHAEGTLVNALMFHLKDNLSKLHESPLRPGIVHRIDKDTSGLLVVAKNDEAHQFLARELKTHQIKRTYLAWVEGKLEHDVMHINLPIGRDNHNRQKMAVKSDNAKTAITHVYVEKVYADQTLVRCELETGRTHQIRVHLAYIKHPIIGDPVYGRKKDDFNQRLHAYRLELKHPRTQEIMHFEAPIPPEFGLAAGDFGKKEHI